jgi:hypothetical protein
MKKNLKKKIIDNIKKRKQNKDESVNILTQILETMKTQIQVNESHNDNIQAQKGINESQNLQIQTLKKIKEAQEIDLSMLKAVNSIFNKRKNFEFFLRAYFGILFNRKITNQTQILYAMFK